MDDLVHRSFGKFGKGRSINHKNPMLQGLATNRCRERETILLQHRPESVVLANGVIIRDQRSSPTGSALDPYLCSVSGMSQVGLASDSR